MMHSIEICDIAYLQVPMNYRDYVFFTNESGKPVLSRSQYYLRLQGNLMKKGYRKILGLNTILLAAIGDMYENGRSEFDLANQYRISPKVIKTILAVCLNVPLRDTYPTNKYLTVRDGDEIEKLWRIHGFRVKKICKIYNIKKKLLCSILAERGIEIPITEQVETYTEIKEGISDTPLFPRYSEYKKECENINIEYKDEMTWHMENIRVLREINKQRSDGSKYKYEPDGRWLRVVKRYKQWKSYEDIEKETGISGSMCRRIIKILKPDRSIADLSEEIKSKIFLLYKNGLDLLYIAKAFGLNCGELEKFISSANGTDYNIEPNIGSYMDDEDFEKELAVAGYILD